MYLGAALWPWSIGRWIFMLIHSLLPLATIGWDVGHGIFLVEWTPLSGPLIAVHWPFMCVYMLMLVLQSHMSLCFTNGSLWNVPDWCINHKGSAPVFVCLNGCHCGCLSIHNFKFFSFALTQSFHTSVYPSSTRGIFQLWYIKLSLTAGLMVGLSIAVSQFSLTGIVKTDMWQWRPASYSHCHVHTPWLGWQTIGDEEMIWQKLHLVFLSKHLALSTSWTLDVPGVWPPTTMPNVPSTRAFSLPLSSTQWIFCRSHPRKNIVNPPSIAPGHTAMVCSLIKPSSWNHSS